MVIPPKTFDFGKYKGSSVEDVLKTDPQYIMWCWVNVERRRLPFGVSTYRDACYAWQDGEDYDVLEDWARELSGE